MAARNRTSKMVILGVGVMVIAVAGTGAWRILTDPAESPDTTPAPQTDNLSGGPGTGEAMADRPGETVRALAEDLENLKVRNRDISDTVTTGIGGLKDQLLQLGEEITALKTDRAETPDYESDMGLLREDMMSSLRSMFEEYESRSGADYPVAGGPPPVSGQGVPGGDGFIWFSAASPEPVGGALDGGLTSLADLRSLGGSNPLGLAPADEEPPEPLPVYTIPADATLVRSRGLTAVIGRVPNEGQLVDPFPFKVITGRDNLLANGQVLPELEQAVWSGIAKGDATLHCASGKLTQVTFIFRDGTISTWPRDGGTTDGIGWISDDRGFPCIPGRFVSNLQENLAGITSSTFAASLARAWSEQQVTTIQDGGAVTRSVTGDPGEYALGQGIAGGINEWARIVADRAREAFDAVVVSPGQSFTVHVSHAIPIDWPPAGRRVRHSSSLAGYEADLKPGGLD